jgi:hypothetical protein
MGANTWKDECVLRATILKVTYQAAFLIETNLLVLLKIKFYLLERIRAEGGF